MSSRSSSSTPQSRSQRRKSRRASRSRLATSAAIAGSKPVARLASCSARHSARSRAKQPGRLEGLADGQHRARPRSGSAPSRSAISPGRRADSRPRRARRPVRAAISRAAGSAKAKAICSPTWSRSVTRRGREILEVEAFGRADGEPVPAADFHCAVRSGPSRLAWCRDRRERCSPARRRARRRSPRRSRPPSSSETSRVFGRGLARLAFCDWSLAASSLRLGALEQRIALDLLVDELVELDMGQLQQPDRLHQLRRHHQGLGLAQL